MLGHGVQADPSKKFPEEHSHYPELDLISVAAHVLHLAFFN